MMGLVPEVSPESSGARRTLVVRGKVPLTCGLKMDEESSSSVHPSRYAAFWAHSCLANCFLPAEEHQNQTLVQQEQGCGYKILIKIQNIMVWPQTAQSPQQPGASNRF